jgi:hypothetical protein
MFDDQGDRAGTDLVRQLWGGHDPAAEQAQAQPFLCGAVEQAPVQHREQELLVAGQFQ